MLRAFTKKYIKLLVSVTLIASLGFSLAWSLSSGYRSLDDSLTDYVENYDYPEGYITTKVTSVSDKDKLMNVDGISDCDTRLCADTVMKTEDGDIYSVRVFSYSDDEKQSFYRWDEKKDVKNGVLLEYNFAKSNGISAGDTVSFRVRDEYRKYKIAGIVSRPETLSAKVSDDAWGLNYDFGYVYAPVSLLKEEYEKDYAENKDKLDDKSDDLSEEKKAAQKLIKEKETQLTDAKKLLKEKLEEYRNSQDQADVIIAELMDTRNELQNSADEISENIDRLNEAYDLADETYKSLSEKYEKLTQAKSALDEIDKLKKQLEQTQKDLTSGSIEKLIGLLNTIPADTSMSVLYDNVQIVSDYLAKAKEEGFSYDLSQPISVLESSLKSFMSGVNSDLSYLTSREVKDLIDKADDSSISDSRYSELISVLSRYSLSRITDAATLKSVYASVVSNLSDLVSLSKQPQVQSAIDLLKSFGTDRTAEELLSEINSSRSTLSILAGDTPIEQLTVGGVIDLYDKALSDTADALSELDKNINKIIKELESYGIDEGSLSSTLAELEDGMSQAQKARSDAKEALSELKDGLSEINDGINEIDSGIEQINQELSDGESQINTAQKEISEGESKLSESAKDMKTFSDLEDELKSAYKKLKDGEGYDMLCNQFLLYFDKDADPEEVLKNAEKALGETEVKSSYIYDDSPVKRRIDNNLDPLSTLMRLLPAVFFVIVLIVVFLFMSMIIHQSRRDIGILTAVGINKGTIRSVFCMMGAGVALAGIIIGTGIGFLLRGYIGGYFKDFFPLPEFTYRIDFGGFILSAISCIAVCVLASLLGTVMISPVQQNVKTSAFLDRILKKSSPMTKFSITSLLRNKGRFIFSTVCVAASVMLIFTSVSFITSKNHVITQTFDERIKYDCQIFFETRPSSKMIYDIQNIDGVTDTESILMFEPNISSDKVIEKATVYAISSDNTMLGIKDMDGSELQVSPGTIIIERHLAEKLDVSKGDTVTVGYKKMTVSGITDQCVNRTQYISDEDAKSFGDPELCSILCRFDSQPRQKLLSYLTECDGYLYTVFTDALYEQNEQLYSTYDLAAWILILFAVLTGFIIVFNTAITNLQDNKRELCVLRTLGFQHRDISLSRFSHSLLQFAVSAVIGLISGFALARFALLKISTPTEEFAFASGIVEILIVLLIVFLYITVSHFSAMHTMKKWDHIEAVKDRE